MLSSSLIPVTVAPSPPTVTEPTVTAPENVPVATVTFVPETTVVPAILKVLPDAISIESVKSQSSVALVHKIV